MEDENDYGAEILEDGELWLPSDFFSMDDVQASTTKFKTPLKLNYYSDFEQCCMDDFAQRFSEFTVHGLNFSQSPPKLQRFTPEDPSRSTVSGPVGCLLFIGDGGGGGQNVGDCTTARRRLGSSPVYPYRLLNPVQSLLHTFSDARPWTLQRQQQWFIPNRVLPIPGSGIGKRGHGGTGVFLPRISTNSSTSIIGTNLNHPAHTKKGQGGRNKLDVQLPPLKNLNNWKQEECHGFVPHEVSLPNDWTY